MRVQMCWLMICYWMSTSDQLSLFQHGPRWQFGCLVFQTATKSETEYVAHAPYVWFSVASSVLHTGTTNSENQLVFRVNFDQRCSNIPVIVLSNSHTVLPSAALSSVHFLKREVTRWILYLCANKHFFVFRKHAKSSTCHFLCSLEAYETEVF